MRYCPRCQGRMLPDEPGEMTCVSCGYVFYGDGFVPLDKANERADHYTKYDMPGKKKAGSYGKQGSLHMPNRGERGRSG